MICPLRFREFASDPAMQDCQPDCAWLMATNGHGVCAAAFLPALLARAEGAENIGIAEREIGGGGDER